MKRIEDIEQWSPDQLEAAAGNEEIPVPEGLRKRIEQTLLVKEIAGKSPPDGRAARLPYAALAAASLAAVALVPRYRERALRDTFDDPYLAYAQVEATFQTISDKMAKGLDLAAKAGENAEKPVEILKNITE